MKTSFLITVLALSCLAVPAQAQDLSDVMPRSILLPGNTQFDGWNDLTAAANPGYPSFPGSGAWPSPIQSNIAGSGDAELDKTAGNAFPGGGAIYFGGFSSAPNSLAGTLSFADINPVANLENVVLQLEIGEAFGFDFYNGVAPTLSYNGGSQNLAATFSELTARVQNGTFTDPVSGLPEPVYVNLHTLQWDLSGVSDPITEFSISFSAVQHAQLYAAQIDQSDTFQQIAAVPEPSTWAFVIAIGLGLIAVRRHRCRSAHA